MSEQRDKQCLGRVGYFLWRRCGRRGNWLFFCADHKDHWLLLVLLLYTGQGLVAEGLDWSDRLRGPSPEELAFHETVYTDISLTCHYWKNLYMTLFPPAFPSASQGDGTQYVDTWDRLAKGEKPPYTRESWDRFRPLFQQGLNDVRRGLQNAAATYADVLSPELRTMIWQVQLQLNLESGTYMQVNPDAPVIPEMGTERAFHVRFEEVFRQLGELDRAVQRYRDEVKAKQEPSG